MVYVTLRAVRHPRMPIAYYYCLKCKLRFNSKEPECPKCHEKVGSSPDPKQESPVPWYVAVIVILAGIGSWIASATLGIPGLDEAARALVYIPLGSLFGMSLKRD